MSLAGAPPADRRRVSLTERVAKPAYLLRPLQIVRRFAASCSTADEAVVRLPWHLELEVRRSEHIGAGIARRGIHEPAVTEVLHRLLRPGDRAVDAGANIGYFTSLMASRCGASGEVLAFEPHPEVAARLRANAARWRSAGRPVADVRITEAAVSDAAGTASLAIPARFEQNMGRASLARTPAAGSVEVDVVRLDDALAGGPPVTVLKIDVEGHEEAALRGAAELLAAGRVRTVVFEEHDALPTPVSTLLAGHGFELFGLEETFTGVRLRAPEAPASTPRWDAPTYLATLDPDDVHDALRRRGWRSLRGSR